MGDDLSDLYSKLNLNADENTQISADSLTTDITEDALSLVGRVLSQRIINFDSISSMFKRLWNPRHGMSCKPLGDNTVLFQFRNQVDKMKTLADSPWPFDKSLLALTEARVSQVGSKLTVTTCPFWFQLHDVPIGLMNKAFATTTGNLIGTFMNVDSDSEGSSIGRYLRIRVILDITKPLRRVIKTTLHDQEYLLPLKYERLPNFCYYCGIIGHGDRECEARILNLPEHASEPLYGAWLRASSTSNPFTSPRPQSDNPTYHPPRNSATTTHSAPPIHEQTQPQPHNHETSHETNQPTSSVAPPIPPCPPNPTPPLALVPYYPSVHNKPSPPPNLIEASHPSTISEPPPKQASLQLSVIHLPGTNPSPPPSSLQPPSHNNDPKNNPSPPPSASLTQKPPPLTPTSPFLVSVPMHLDTPGRKLARKFVRAKRKINHDGAPPPPATQQSSKRKLPPSFFFIRSEFRDSGGNNWQK
ncbi:hypothetical protein DH2020_012739 [Rehmannia glutinosa]|uniref:CCHC-type domain-containing protein n=1 Tax=Rehmannia glutinosa TaxID=99300 RepID=A0ABR0X3S6_REHGL